MQTWVRSDCVYRSSDLRLIIMESYLIDYQKNKCFEQFFLPGLQDKAESENIETLFFSCLYGKKISPLFCQLFFENDLQNGLVGLDHAVVAEGAHVLNGFLR